MDHIHPKLVIVIDSLASKSVARISSTIQLADTGITPGAGVGNKRKELSKETLGIPVIALRSANGCRFSNHNRRLFRLIY